MGDDLELLIYLDENLIKNLSSVFFYGYIDIRTYRKINDNCIDGKLLEGNKEQFYDEDRYSKDIREGYKGKTCSEVGTYQNSIENNKSFETREVIRQEEETKRIFTVFALHRQLINAMYEKKILTKINELTICNREISQGEYIKIRGDITTVSLVSYLDILIDVLKCYGTEYLDTLLIDKNLGKLNYTKILNMLNHLLELLTKNNTQDLIIKCNKETLIVTVNTKFFLNENSSIFDKVNCPCEILGKIMRTCYDGKNLSLLRKTAQVEYYEKLIKSIKPFLDLLQDEGLILPTMPELIINDHYLLVVPLSIYI
ncbi:hypothetical protein J1C67_15310 [Clostridium gasigenes]|uniref:DUF6414 family protein n=1 Tax=Clostridium gasigenes TaxID=94869 RepID=UPI00143826DF|nr:hypothetical protein [Clostridium gasigenes]NKF05448.1 hypothetical protein [Clostridium gasigenes]QSW18894.1 hypothetical protein J1C67_15310 [Clostridium gasigenes]